MPHAKLLQYESLRTVLFHMDANISVLLSNRCPSIRITERDVSLKIKLLKFQHVETILNDTSYKLGIVRDYPEGVEIPRRYQQENDHGGVSWDLDKFGFTVDSESRVLTTGDVPLRRNMRSPDPLPYEAMMQVEEIEQMFETCKNKLARRIEMDTLEEEMAANFAAQEHPLNSVPWFEVPNYRVPIFPLVLIEELHRDMEEEYYDESNPVGYWSKSHNPEQDEYEELMETSLSALQERKDDVEASYLPFYYRKHNMSPPFTPLLQLTIESPEGKRIHKFPYRYKLQDAMKKLNTVLLGGRNQPVKVKEMVLEEDMVVLRLPIGLKLSLKALSATAEAIHLLAPLMEESPFDQLHITRTCWFPEVLRSPAVHTAQKLIIEQYDFRFMEPQEPADFMDPQEPAVFEDLPNLVVELKSLMRENLEEDDFSRVLQSWISNGRPDGTHYSIELPQDENNQEFFEAIGNLDGAMKGNRSFTFPMINGLHLTVSYHESVAYFMDDDGEEVTGSEWSVEFKVHGEAAKEF